MCGDVYEEIEECVLNIHCLGNCRGKCEVENNIIVQNMNGNILQTILGSTQDEHVRCVHCPGHCRGACSLVDRNNEHNTIGHSLDTVRNNISSSDDIHNKHSTGYTVQTDRPAITVASTMGPGQGLACVDRSGWKSSQAVNIGGVSGSMGVKASVGTKPKPGLDWNRVGGVVHKEEGSCMNSIEEEGVQYCPGEELPTYIYTEYKPTFSGKKNTNFSHFTIGLEDKTAPVDKEKDMVTVLDVNT